MNMETNSQKINDDTKKEKKIERLRPSVLNKPKPPLAKKPVIASKPANLVNSTGRKAEDASSELSFSATNGKSFSRPKGPPPPLPKDPPQGPTCQKSLSSLPKNPSVVSKTQPPPLPKTPPRGPGGVRRSSSTDLHSPTCSPQVLAYTDIKFENTFPLQSNVISQTVAFHSDSSFITSDENVVSDTLSSKESTLENNKDSVLSVHNESINGENKNNSLGALPQKHQVLKYGPTSTQFYVHDMEEDKTVGKNSDPCSLTIAESADSNCADQAYSSESQIQHSFSKEQPVIQCKPSQQKPVPRRPAPKVPSKSLTGKIPQSTANQEPGSSENVNGPSRNKPNTNGDYRDGISVSGKLSPAITREIGSHNAKENSYSDCQDHNIEPCLTPDKIDNTGNYLVDKSFVTLRKKSRQDSGDTSDSSVNRVLEEVHPMPTHVNSGPIEKPRPVPRKRLSLSRQSDKLDETQSLHSASSNLSLKTDSRDSDVNVNKIQETGSSLSLDKVSGESFTAREHVKDVLENRRNNIQRHQMVLNDSDVNVPKSAILTVQNCDTYATINDNDSNNVDGNDNVKTDENDNKKIDLHNSKQQKYGTNAEEGRAIHKRNIGISDSDKSDKKESSSLKGSFENILGDNSDTSSLLNEIEAILSRSYKQHIILNEVSSEKLSSSCNNLDKIYKSRSMSLDSGSNNAVTDDIPVKPPRIKKEQLQQKLKNNSVIRHLADLETVSLPDYTQSLDRVELGQSSHGYFITEREDGTRTLGPARKHPPKPERKKLLSVQRSQSDLSQRKIVDTRVSDVQRSKSSATGAQSNLNDGRSNSGLSSGATVVKKSETGSKPNSYRTPRPARKAPPPPNLVQNIVSGNSGRVPLLHTGKGADVSNTDNVKDPSSVSVYHCINDADIKDFSDEDHDYHEIPDDLDENEDLKLSGASSLTSLDNSSSPPKLPPRNCISQHMDSSSVSSLTHDIDNISVVTGGSSSTEDSYIEPEVTIKIIPSEESPELGRKREFSGKAGKSRATGCTSQKKIIVCDSLTGSEGSLVVSNASEGCDKGELRPDSSISLISSHSDSGSHGSHMPDDLLSSSESEAEGEESKVMRKKERKLYLIAQEIVSSERVFVDVLKLLNLDFRVFVSKAAERHGRPVIPADTLNRILDYLPQLQNFNEDLLKDLEERLSKWESQKRISDIFVKKGPFLKLYSSYIRDFENMTTMLDDAIKRHPHFQEAVREFETSTRCANLRIKHYMLKPIQRIPQYRLLLQDYMKHLPPDFPDLKDTQTALNIVSEVAEHANESMRHGDHVQKLLEIQRSLIGQFEVIKPGRDFLKDGELKKLSRKEMQPRKFFLFSDVLLYTTPVPTGYRLNNVLPLIGMKVTVPNQDEFKTEFSIISVQRSFTVVASSPQERNSWISALNSAINENSEKRSTFDSIRAGPQSLLDKDFILGHKAPPWIPDSRVTMCMLCTCNFSITWRRHHCRACGKVVCGNCSDKKAPLRYLKYKAERVCSACFTALKAEAEQAANEKVSTQPASPEEEPKEIDESSPDGANFSLGGLLERFTNIRRSGQQSSRFRPAVLKEVHANDQGATMSGYLKQLKKSKKWKRFWFVLKDKVLYTFKASEDMAAITSMVLLGYEVTRFSEYYEGVEPGLVFECTHKNQPPVVFCTDSSAATEKWVTVMREASVA
ncbi:hypothetical protein CHS0354_009591 [Potamilus streckersoni]|uniref:FYVE, RhoGEF and PH domain-containing protein 6 n=1 Tax=Potamilus streckersoni TaxID=2493646 RepID=A0AAE0SP12_9BIVA|nr:hypothetical protein CHS0354_009591 [Potamilus streckersoni]